MKTGIFLGSRNNFVVSFIFILFSCFASLLSYAELPPGVVPITAEPNHKVRFENNKVRMIEAQVPKGKKSLFHEHQYDGFYAFFKADGFINEPYGEKPISPDLKTGTVLFIPADKPYIHRVGASEKQGVHVSVVELLKSTRIGEETAEARFPPFELALENPRGRIYRLKLSPGESTEVFTRPANTAIFAINSGEISEKSEDKPESRWELASGKFRWIDSGDELTISNVGKTAVEMVEIEVF